MTTDDSIPVSDEILADFVYMCRWYGIQSSRHSNIIIFAYTGLDYEPVIPFIEAEWK